MASIKKDGGFNSFPIAYKRGNPIALDTTAVWYSKTELETYAASGVTAYVGQVVTLVDEANNTCEAFMIANKAGTLVKLAQTTASGDLASDVATLQTQVNSLLATVNGTGEGNDHVKGLVEKLADVVAEIGVAGTESEDATGIYAEIEKKADIADTLAGYGITDAYTAAKGEAVEGRVEALETAVGDSTKGLVKDVADLKTTVGTETSGLVKDVADNADAIETLEGVVGDSTKGLVKDVADLKTNKLDKSVYDEYIEDHSYTDDDIDAKVAGAFHFKGEATSAPSDNDTNIVANGTTIAAAKANEGDVYVFNGREYASNGSKWVELGFGTDLSSYYTKAEVNTELAKKVDVVEGKSLISDSEITRLAAMSDGANKVEASETNGNIKIDGTEVTVYEADEDTVIDADYVHITVTEKSVSDGTNTFNKYDDTALAARVAAFEAGGAHDVAALEGKVGAPTQGETAATGLYAEIEKANTATGSLALTSKHVTTKYDDVTAMVQAVDTEVHANADAIAKLNGAATEAGSVAKAIADKVGDLTLTNTNHTTTTYDNVTAALDAVDGEIHAVDAKIDGLGDLAALDEVTETQLASALATKINSKADSATTLGGYGITDAKIDNGVITLGANTITPVTSLAGYATEEYVGNQIGELKIGDTNYSTVKGYVDAKAAAIEGNASTLEGKVTAIENTLNGTETADGLVTKQAADASNIATLQGYFTNGVANDADKLDGHDSDYFATATDIGAAGTLSGANNDTATGGSGILGEITKLQAKDNGQGAKITALETTVGDADSGLVKDVADLKAIGSTKVEASTTNGNIKIDGVETTVYTEVANTVHDANYKHITVTGTSVSDGTNTFTKYDDTELAGKVSALEGKVGDDTKGLVKDVAELQSKITGLTGAMHFIGTATNAVTDGGTQNPGIAGSGENGALVSGDVVLYGSQEYIWNGSAWEIFGDEGSYAVKATTLSGYGITDAYTKDEVNTELAKKVDVVEGKSLVSDTEITKLAGVSTGANKVEATAKSGSISIDGTEVQIVPDNIAIDADYHHVTVSATDGVTSDGVTYKYDDTALANRVKALEDASPEENVIEEVQVNGTALAVTDKAVNIPLATLAAAGVVVGVADTVDNGVQVAADGTMGVKRVNANTLVQTAGEFVIIDGGNAALTVSA